jgi:hypothetical protein
MSSLEFLGMMVLIYWCGPPAGPWYFHYPPPDLQPRYNRFIANAYYVSLAGLVFTTAVTHPEQALSAQYGPFMVLPVVQVLAGLYYNNVAVRGGAKAKV